MSKNSNKTYLYRIENSNISSKPDGVTSHEDIVGQWFSPDPVKVIQYLRKSQRAPGVQLVVATVPTETLAGFHVSSHPIAVGMDVEPDNYLIPRDGSCPMVKIPLDELVGDLNPNNIRQRLEAVERIQSQLGALSLVNHEQIL